MVNNQLLSKLEDVADQVKFNLTSISFWIKEFRALAPSIPHHQNDQQKFHFHV